ncbi:membrane protein insertase YidC [Lujinxingia vulgaris]|uniref:Membrane protein insertase YidC n=1 Tax=Lujinxingia vulgaris TaxID=2600176 RepID=A0A5C6X061_9DELT|nr:membrane protein insertase YidC [Lujinxingia vulgaris]TXD34426.1 membrane protein insertase YidC [Lujinxingia vulgaris]
MEQKRFILAMSLITVVFIVWQAVMGPGPDELAPEGGEAVTEQAAGPGGEDAAAPAESEGDESEAARAMPAAEPDDAPVEAPVIEERSDVLASDKVSVTLNNQGAVATDIQVTSPDQYAGEGGDLLRSFEENAPAYPFTTRFRAENVQVAPDAGYELIEDLSELNADGKTFKKITYRYTDPRGRFSVDKIYAINGEQPYVVDFDVVVHNRLEDVRLVDTLLVDVIGKDDPNRKSNFLDFRPDQLEAVCRNSDDMERTLFEQLEETTTFSQYPVIWAGADTRYFLMAAIPEKGAKSCVFERLEGDYLRTNLTYEGFSIAPNERYTESHLLYLGPKDFGVLKDVGYKIEEAVDYGLLTVLARPLRALLVFFFGFTGNWGIAIILLTLLIKLLSWPLTQKAYVSAERMKQIQPIIKEIREKYENDQQRMTEETMKVFKEHNVSPLGCLPMLLQMPILYGLFVMIYNSVELYQADFLWYTDLSAPDPIFLLPIIMGAVMVLQQRLTMVDQSNPQMAMMMKIMPIMFTAFMLFLPSGLVLYYLLNLVLGLLQQYMIKRQFAATDEGATTT